MDWTALHFLYVASAIPGIAYIVLQFFGIGDTDTDVDTDSDGFKISLSTVLLFFVGFGLGGLLNISWAGERWSLVIALGTGVVTAILLAKLVKWLHRFLSEEENFIPSAEVGDICTPLMDIVRLPGLVKVQKKIGDRVKELTYSAKSTKPVRTGTLCHVVSVDAASNLLVIAPKED